MDDWDKWRVVCLAALSVEDIEDLYLFGTMITGLLLIGLGVALSFKKNQSTEAAVQSPTWLPGLIGTMGKAADTQTVTLSRILESLVVSHRTLEKTLENISERLATMDRRLDGTLALIRNRDNI